MKYLAALLVLSACATSAPMTPVQEVEAHMKGYTEAWNRHDPAAIAKSFYRLGPTVEEQTRNLEKTFADLKARGYDHSDIYEIKGCMTGPDTAWAAMKFSRLKTDGSPLQANMASAYLLTKFPDGWRITKMGAGGASFDKPLTCPGA